MAGAKQENITNNYFGFSNFAAAFDTEPPPFTDSDDERDSDGERSYIKQGTNCTDVSKHDVFDGQQTENHSEPIKGGFADFGNDSADLEANTVDDEAWADWSSFSVADEEASSNSELKQPGSITSAAFPTNGIPRSEVVDHERINQGNNEGQVITSDTGVEKSEIVKHPFKYINTDEKSYGSGIDMGEDLTWTNLDDKDSVILNDRPSNISHLNEFDFDSNTKTVSAEENSSLCTYRTTDNQNGKDLVENHDNNDDVAIHTKDCRTNNCYDENFTSVDFTSIQSKPELELQAESFQFNNFQIKEDITEEVLEISQHDSVSEDEAETFEWNSFATFGDKNTDYTIQNTCGRFEVSRENEENHTINCHENQDFHPSENSVSKTSGVDIHVPPAVDDDATVENSFVTFNPSIKSSLFDRSNKSRDNNNWASFEASSQHSNADDEGSVAVTYKDEKYGHHSSIECVNNAGDSVSFGNQIDTCENDDEVTPWATFTSFDNSSTQCSVKTEEINTNVNENEPNRTCSAALQSNGDDNDDDQWANFSSFAELQTEPSSTDSNFTGHNVPIEDNNTSWNNVDNKDAADVTDDWACFSSAEPSSNIDSISKVGASNVSSVAIQDKDISSISIKSEETKTELEYNKPKEVLTQDTGLQLSLPLQVCFSSKVADSKLQHQLTRRKSQCLDMVIHDNYLQGEQGIWRLLKKAADKEDTFKVVYMSSVGIKWMLSTVNLAFENVTLRKHPPKSPGLATPQTLSPASSIGSFDLQEMPLEPVQVLMNDFNVRSEHGRQTLLAQSLQKEVKGGSVRRVASCSSLKKDSGSETASETNSLDLEFFSSGGISIAGSIPQISKGDQPISAFGLDLLDVNFSIQSDPSSQTSEEAIGDAQKEESLVSYPDDTESSDRTIDNASSMSSSSLLKSGTLSVATSKFLNELEDLNYVTSPVLMFPTKLLQDHG